MRSYRENIQKLRSGTALSTAEFVRTVRDRHFHEFGEHVKCAIVDPNIFTSPENADTLSDAIVLSLDDVEKNKATASPVRIKENSSTIITFRESGDTFLDELCDTTGWHIEDIKYTKAQNSVAMLEDIDHETGHAVLYNHINREDPFENKSDDYNAFVHECVADAYSALSAIHDGMDKSYIDMVALSRTYGAICDMDTKHYTVPTLHHLKEVVDESHIQNLPNKKAVADYCLKLVLGDAEEGREPMYLSESAFEQLDDVIVTLCDKVKAHAEQTKTAIPTPLQFQQKMVDEPEFFSAEEKEFLERYVVPQHTMMIHANDLEKGLINQAQFEKPTRLQSYSDKLAFLSKEVSTPYEQELLDKILPLDDEGHRIDLDTEDQLAILHRQKRFIEAGGEMLECGTSKQQALETIHSYQETLNDILDKEEERHHIHSHERSQDFVELGDDRDYER